MSLRDPHTYRGGRPRRHSAQTSYFLSTQDARKALRAYEFARRVGLPLNVHVTINFPSAIAEERVAKYIAQTVQHLRQWLRRQGVPGSQTTHLWVRETKPGEASHMHLLLHAPTSVAGKLTNRRFAMLIPREAGILPSEIQNTAGRNSGSPVLVLRAQDDDQIEAWGRYVLKGVSAASGLELGLDPKRQGLIVGKRIGVAENIGATEWMHWAHEYKIGGREFALRRWRERAEMSKRPPR